MPKLQPTWQVVEKAVKSETRWLKQNISPYELNKNPIKISDEFLYRQIAILIVSSKLKAKEYLYSHNQEEITKKYSSTKKHGSDWHNSMINYIAHNYKKLRFTTYQDEPKLYYGYCDLKITKGDVQIYFEIDTVNIFKLYINLLLMKKNKLVIINYDKIIEFSL